MAVGVVLAVLLGYVLERAFFSFLYGREHLQQVLMTCPVYRLFISGVCLVLALGIDIKFLYRVAVLAGMVAAPVSSVYPNMGDSVLIICFVIVVIGGIGSIRGTLLAALLIGFVDTFGKVFLPQAAGMLVYASWR